MAKSDPKNWNDYEIVEQTDDNEYPPSKSLFTGSDAPQISERGRQASRLMDQRLTEIREQEDFGFDDSTLGFQSDEDLPIETYGEQESRTEALMKRLENDLNYSAYFYSRYGNVDFYFSLEDIYKQVGFDSTKEIKANIKIIKEGTVYIAGSVTPNQIIEELLDGVVSFLVFKVNGQAAEITGTLKAELVNGEEHVRQAAFSPISKGRILLWNVWKQKWSSFYPTNMLEMTRDDTSDFE